MLNEH